MSSRSLDGSNGVGTVATYINANIRTNTSLVSDRVRMGSEQLSPVFTKWRIGGVVFARWKVRHFNEQIATKSGKMAIYHQSVIRVNAALLIDH